MLQKSLIKGGYTWNVKGCVVYAAPGLKAMVVVVVAIGTVVLTVMIPWSNRLVMNAISTARVATGISCCGWYSLIVGACV